MIVLPAFSLAGCGVYSFTGANITAETISIQQFYNDAEGGPPDMPQTFTNKLKDYYLSNTNLGLVDEDGELQLEGSITGYRLTPIAPTASNNDELGGNTSALTRLTITVQVTYINTEDDQFNFENKSFSFYSDFDSDQNLTAIEATLLDEIFDQIILDIFNASVANW
ncbi:LptE family protein [Fulvivirga sediminis]|uniref:LptE family protein n=1 Tax=Fulvivirga sediminis TaxID=2803949 RepID=A0A937F7C9_9BACT|nr:LptE family protein [Fulvivirga sediminis]MBL3655680.1 LptE family protein [Fulvivirga sediminis]